VQDRRPDFAILGVPRYYGTDRQVVADASHAAHPLGWAPVVAELDWDPKVDSRDIKVAGTAVA
jgi:hypothetical protein